jgi:hypothetical protein
MVKLLSKINLVLNSDLQSKVMFAQNPDTLGIMVGRPKRGEMLMTEYANSNFRFRLRLLTDNKCWEKGM